MSPELRAKQREFLKLARPFFDKSLVRSYSSFEKPCHRPGHLKIAHLSTKANYAAFLLSKNPIMSPGSLSMRPARFGI